MNLLKSDRLGLGDEKALSRARLLFWFLRGFLLVSLVSWGFLRWCLFEARPWYRDHPFRHDEVFRSPALLLARVSYLTST